MLDFDVFEHLGVYSTSNYNYYNIKKVLKIFDVSNLILNR